MSSGKARAIHRAWEKWPHLDVEQVAELVSHGWDAAASSLEKPAPDLAEQGRRLASEREDLIVQGVDPGLLAVPLRLHYGPWIDKQGDVWTIGVDGLLHTPETAAFPREHVEKKWGPLRLLESQDPQTQDGATTNPSGPASETGTPHPDPTTQPPRSPEDPA